MVKILNKFTDPIIEVTDTDLSQAYNIGLRCFGLLIYILFLFCIVSNIAIFVIGKQRYKDFFIVMYYIVCVKS